jgi:hemerythrin
MEAGAERAAVEHAMREFGDYAVRHFSRDEECTLRGSCPALEWNGMARAEMIRIIADFRRAYETEGATATVAGQLSDNLCGWVSKYIPGPDAGSLPCVVAAQ